MAILPATVLADLIDKRDSSEIIRDRVGEILAVETVNQVALATAAGKPSPNDWLFRVFLERSNPLEIFMDRTVETPVVNVTWEGGEYDKSRGNPIFEQALIGVVNVDTLAVGVSRDDPGGGHIPGDLQASRNCEFTARLVRNILMAALNVRLQLPRIVTDRWSRSVTAEQPESPDDAFQFAAIGFALEVVFTEQSPQVDGEPLEFVMVDIMRTSDGQLIAEADYDYT